MSRENVIALGNSGTGDACSPGLRSCCPPERVQRRLHHRRRPRASADGSARRTTDSWKLQRDLQAVKLLIIDELGYVPLSPDRAELLFEVFPALRARLRPPSSRPICRSRTDSVLGSDWLTGALLDRLTHHVHILTMNGDSYRLKQSAGRRRPATPTDRAEQNQAIADTVNPGDRRNHRQALTLEAKADDTA
ncbi:MAG: ATP-binding protein, partial [Rhodospirillales bacterium]|nr:ATP-binding protein [Rhodospirillales bacterium]